MLEDPVVQLEVPLGPLGSTRGPRGREELADARLDPHAEGHLSSRPGDICCTTLVSHEAALRALQTIARCLHENRLLQMCIFVRV